MFEGVAVVDTMVMLPPEPSAAKPFEFVDDALGQNAGTSKSPVAHLFGDLPALPDGCGPIDYTLREMDRFGISHALVDIAFDPSGAAAVRQHPDRFIGILTVDPNSGMQGLRALEQAHRDFDIRAASLTPAFYQPQVSINDARMYPIYAKCIELDIPVFVTVGVPGPRVPCAPQRVELLDEVCWFFPELRVIMRHGAEPWQELAVKLMLKWPNLHYSTSAFAPRHYPKAIIDYANTRGCEKVMYAGYFAVGLTWDRIFAEFKELPLRDEVWPKFLAENATRVLRLGPGADR